MTAAPEDATRRGALGLVLMAVPILSILAVALGYAVLLWYGSAGRPATGAATVITFEACPEARPFIRSRVEAIGLPDAHFGQAPGGFTLSTRLPEQARVAEAIPGTLAKPGRFAVTKLDEQGDALGGEPIATEAHIAYATVYMGFLDTPRALVQLEQAQAQALRTWMESNPHKGVAMLIDGERVADRRNMPSEAQGKLELDLVGRSDLERMDFAAATAIVLDHGPLPCPVSVVSVSTEEPPR